MADEIPVARFVVGERCPYELPSDASMWLTSIIGHALLLATLDPHPELTRGWRYDRLEMRARATDSYVHISYRLGDGSEYEWGECMPTGLDIEPGDMLDRCQPGEGTRIAMVLVDTRTQRVVSLRECAPSTTFSNYIIDGLGRSRSSNLGSYQRQCAAAQAYSPTANALRANEIMVWLGETPTN